jgi:hypothetical protein
MLTPVAPTVFSITLWRYCRVSVSGLLYNRYVDFVAGTVAVTTWEMAQTAWQIIKSSQVTKPLFSR